MLIYGLSLLFWSVNYLTKGESVMRDLVRYCGVLVVGVVSSAIFGVGSVPAAVVSGGAVVYWYLSSTPKK